MDNSGRASWSRTDNFAPLRKPRNRDDGSSSSSGQTQFSTALSPNAAVFVPQNKVVNNSNPIEHFQQQQHHHHQQQHQQQQHQHPLQQLQQQHQHQHPHQHHPQQQQHHHHHPNHNFNHQHNVNSLSNNFARARISNSVQDRLNVGPNRHESSVSNANAHHPPPMLPPPDQALINFHNLPPSQDLPIQSEEEQMALDYIFDIVKCLNGNPGLFDTVQERFVHIFDGFASNRYIMSNAMEIIFNQSIEEQNFRYMGAKLYGLLDSIILRKNSMFRELLLLKLNFHQTEVLKYMQNEQHKVRGTTLFLAELYMQLRNDGSSIKEIAHSIVFTMNQLLLKTTPENIKCICLTLKLAGYELEKDCKSDIIKIIEILRSVKSMDVGTSRVLETVLNLRSTNWGRDEPLTRDAPPPVTYDAAANFSNEPVFYGPDGQVMTEEENSFLESNIPHDAQNDDDNDSDDELEFDPEMDEEMSIAYKDFLKTHPNSNQC